MTKNDALKVLAKLQARKALFISTEEIMEANDALIDAGDYANAAKIQTLAHLFPTD